MSNNLLIVPSDTDKTLVMVPVQAVKQDLVTKTDYLIYVPLASKEAHGTVKIGDGISVINGVISIDPSGDILNTKVDKYQGKDKYKQALIVDSEGYVTTGYAPSSIDVYKNASLVGEDSSYLRFSDDFRILNEDKGVNIALINPIPVKTSDITNDGDGKSPYATQDFVAVNGGKIDTIYVNNEVSPINNKAVYLQIPTKLSDLGIDKDIAYVDDVSKAVSEHNVDKNAHYNIQTKLLEVEAIAKGRSKIVTYNDYTSMIRAFNVLPINEYAVGQSVFIKTLKVPDLWISSVDETSELYAYTSDDVIVSALKEQGYIKVGYYNLSPLETEKVDLTNYVTLNGIQRISGIKTFTSMIGLLNSAEGEADFIKHINNNFLITSHDGKSLLNIDEQLEKIYSFNKELANKEFIKDNYLSFTESQTLTSDEQALIRSKIGAAGGELNLDYTKLINLPTLKTNNSGSLNPSEEEINGVINLHKISKTGLLSDLIDDTNHRTVTDSEKTSWNNKASNTDFLKLEGTVDVLQTTTQILTDSYNQLYTDKVDKSSLTDYVKFDDYAGTSTAGVIKVSTEYGTYVRGSGILQITSATEEDIDAKASSFKPIVPTRLDYAVKSGLTTNSLEWTDDEKTSARTLIDAVGRTDYATSSKGGVVKVSTSQGLKMSDTGTLYFLNANAAETQAKTTTNRVLTPKCVDYIVKYGMTDNKLEWTDEEKTNARLLINAASSIESGNKLNLSIDTTTYIMTLQLLNKNDEVLDTKTLDLPLESVVVDGRLDEDTDEIVLVLKNGNEIRFSVADVIKGLATQAEVNELSNRVSLIENKNTEQDSTLNELQNKKANQSDLIETNYFLGDYVTEPELSYKLGRRDIPGYNILPLDMSVTINQPINVIVDSSGSAYPIRLKPKTTYNITDKFNNILYDGAYGKSYKFDNDTGAIILTFGGVIYSNSKACDLVFIDKAELYYGPVEILGTVYNKYSAFVCKDRTTGELVQPTYNDTPERITSLYSTRYTGGSSWTIRDIDNLNNYTKTSDLSKVALSNSYDDLDNRPIIPEGAVIYHNFGPNTDGSISQKVMTEKFEEMEANIANVAPRDGKLTFTKDGREVGSFSANQETDSNIIIDGIPIVKTGNYLDSTDYDNIYEGEYDSIGWSTLNYPGITELYEGLTIAYKIPGKPGKTRTTIYLNGLGPEGMKNVPIVTGNREPISSEIPIGTVLILTYCNITENNYTQNYWMMNDYGNNDYSKIRHPIVIASSIPSYYGLCSVSPDTTNGRYSPNLREFDITYPLVDIDIKDRPKSGDVFDKTVVQGKITYVWPIFSNNHTRINKLPVYLKGTLNGTTFTAYKEEHDEPGYLEPYYTQVIPTEEDGYQYMLISVAIDDKYDYLFSEHPIYEYKDGAFRKYTYIPNEVITETKLTAKGYATTSDVDSKDTTTLNSAKAYTDAQINSLVGDADGNLDTIYELSMALENNKDIISVLRQSITDKVDKVTGKGLSTNDYTTDEKNKLAGIATGAEVNVQSDWNATSGDAFIKNKPTIPTKTSQLTNDSGFLTSVPSEYVTETELTNKGYATKQEGVYFVDGTGNATEGVWSGTNNRITSYYDGLVVNFKVGIAGISDGTTLNINGLGAKPCYLRGTTKVTTHYAVGTVVMFTYSASADAFYSSDYDANNYAYARQYGNVTTNSNFPVLFSKSATVPSTYTNNYTSSQSGFTYNPSTKTMTVPTLNASTALKEGGTALSSKYLGINAKASSATTADTATKATQDGSGNVITSTYAKKTELPTKTSQLTNDSGFITGYTETDPTVPSWAKASSKPSYSYSEITNKPTLATVATTGSYNDLTNKPTIPSAITIDSALSSTSTNPVQNKVINTALSGKALADLSNVSQPTINGNGTFTGNDRVVETKISSDGLTWYRIWASGWKECGGQATGVYWNSHTSLFTLPLSFSNTNYTVVGTCVQTKELEHLYEGVYFKISSNQQIQIATSYNSNAKATLPVRYYACGY